MHGDSGHGFGYPRDDSAGTRQIDEHHRVAAQPRRGAARPEGREVAGRGDVAGKLEAAEVALLKIPGSDRHDARTQKTGRLPVMEIYRRSMGE
ncbi:conserved hypothetical protein [Citreicella sp. SE45]|nr:conserved hypothetical protein [Citreicella sp. SE45]